MTTFEHFSRYLILRDPQGLAEYARGFGPVRPPVGGRPMLVVANEKPTLIRR